MTAKKAASSEKKADASYRVVAPLIQVEVGSQLLQYSFGDVLPNGLSEESIEHLTENGLIQKGEVVTEPDDSSEDE